MSITDIFVLFQDAAGTCPPQRHRAVGVRESERPHLPFRHCTKMLVRCLASLLTPTAPSKSPASLKGKCGCFILKRTFLYWLKQVWCHHSAWLRIFVILFCILPIAIKEGKGARFTVVYPVLCWVWLHYTPAVRWTHKHQLWLFLCSSQLLPCTIALVCFCILGIPLRLLIYLEIILTIKPSTDSPHLAL